MLAKAIFLGVTFFLFSCARLPDYSSESRRFSSALKYVRLEQAQQAKPLLQDSCEKDQFLSACIALGKSYDRQSLTPFSILQGHSDENNVHLNVVLPVGNAFKFIIWEADNAKIIPEKYIRFEKKTFSHSKWYVYQILITNLDILKQYRLDIYDHNYKVLDSRIFSPLKTTGRSLSFVAASCMSDAFAEQSVSMWKDVEDLSPDIILAIGDNVYADVVSGKYIGGISTPERLWERYVETRNNLYLYFFPKLVPIYASWDDHDYGTNDGDKSFPYKDESAKIFKTFFYQPPLNNLRKGKGIGQVLRFRNQQFFFLDNRSFRDSSKEVGGEHFGKEQLSWLYDEMKKYHKPTWLISGDQFFGGYHPFESYEGNHPRSFHFFLEELKKFKWPIVFLSGDRHLSEIIDLPAPLIGHQTYELTSSAIHSKVYPGTFERHPNLRGLVGVDGQYNYMFIKATSETSHKLVLSVTDYGEDKAVLFQKNLVIEN